MECVLEKSTVHYEMLGDRGMPLVILHGGQAGFSCGGYFARGIRHHRPGLDRAGHLLVGVEQVQVCQALMNDAPDNPLDSTPSKGLE